MPRFQLCFSSILLSVLALWSAGCESFKLPTARGDTRAMWVTRFDYKTEDDIRRIAESCKLAGCNTILFQVRGNGTAFYRSSYEPWAEQFNYADPGFDPLEVAVKAAHDRGLKLQAWVNVVPAWWGQEPPQNAKQLYNKKPEWAWYDKSGKRQPLADKFYVSLNPCLPEVREYLVNVIEDIVGRYAIDGVHLDYIRFPNEPAGGIARPEDYPRDKQTLAIFKADTGKTPETAPEEWSSWRAEQITNLVRDIRRMVNGNKPYIEITAAVGPVPDKARSEHFQDVRKWIDEKLVDAVYPMNYTKEKKVFDERVEVWKKFAGKTPVVMGVRIDDDIAMDRAQLETALNTFHGYSIFAYSTIFDSPNAALDKQDDATRERRMVRRKALLPQLHELAHPGEDRDAGY